MTNVGKMEAFGPLKRILLLLPLWVAHVCGAADLAVQVAEPALWSAVLKSVGLEATLHENRFSIVVGNSPAARKLGFRPTAARVRVAQVADARAPQLDIYWQEPLELPVFDLPPGARIFAQEKHTGAPLVAGLKREKGAVLWVAVGPGPKGYERFPYLIHALVDLGLTLPLRGARTWAFFDYSYRTRADPDYLAEQWREAGIAALHVSAWHFHDPDPQRDAYLEGNSGFVVGGWRSAQAGMRQFRDERSRAVSAHPRNRGSLAGGLGGLKAGGRRSPRPSGAP